MIIKGAKVATKDGDKIVDVLIEDGFITEVSSFIDVNNEERVEANGLYLLPSIVDLNISLKNRVFKLEYLNRLKSKALKSGVTSFVLMPNFIPKLSSNGLVELLSTNINADEIILAIDGVDAEDKKLNEIARGVKDGVRIIKLDSDVDGNLVKRIFEYSLMLDIPLFVGARNESMDGNGVLNDGEVSFSLGLEGISKLSEISEVAKISSFLEVYDIKLLFQSLTTYSALEKVQKYKNDGSRVFSEVSIAHLLFNDKKALNFNTFAKVYPPLSDEEGRLKLIEALKNGMIDTITTLQSAVSYSKKDVAFNDALGGVNILEQFLPLCYTYLVKNGYISLYELTRLISYNPAKIVGLKNIGEIKEGFRADMILFDPTVENQVELKSIIQGLKLFGDIKMVIKDGKVAI